MPDKIQKIISMYRVELSGCKEIIITSYRNWLMSILSWASETFIQSVIMFKWFNIRRILYELRQIIP